MSQPVDATARRRGRRHPGRPKMSQTRTPKSRRSRYRKSRKMSRAHKEAFPCSFPHDWRAKTERCHYFSLCDSRKMSLAANRSAAPERSNQAPAIAEDVTRSRRLVQLSQSGRSGRNVTTMIQALRLEVFNQDRLGSTKDVTGTAADYCEISLQLICNVPPKLEAD